MVLIIRLYEKQIVDDERTRVLPSEGKGFIEKGLSGAMRSVIRVIYEFCWYSQQHLDDDGPRKCDWRQKTFERNHHESL